MRDRCQCFGANSPHGGGSPATPPETLRTQTSAPSEDRLAAATIARRQFLRHLVGVGVLTIASTIAPAAARAEKKVPKALVLSCIDYRILEAERYFLSLQNLGGQYDFTALAGASLALSGMPHQYDADAFWDQLDISYRLHQIKKVLILDHQDCAVYQYKIDPSLNDNRELELATHTEYLSRAYWAIRERYPDLNIELYFVYLNTEVKQISPLAKA